VHTPSQKESTDKIGIENIHNNKIKHNNTTEMEELTCGNIENTRIKYMMPPIKSNCQFFFRNLRIFPNAICNKFSKNVITL